MGATQDPEQIYSYIQPCDEALPSHPKRCFDNAKKMVTEIAQEDMDDPNHLPVLITASNVEAVSYNQEYGKRALNLYCNLLNFMDNSGPHCDDYPKYTFNNTRPTYDEPSPLAYDSRQTDKSVWWYISCMSQGCDGDVPS